MLRALRRMSGWPRAVALAVMLALTLGLVHTHAQGDGNAEVAVSLPSDHGHDHDGGLDGTTRASTHCAFCAVVAGKFFLPAIARLSMVAQGVAVRWVDCDSRFKSASIDRLFRPPTSSDSPA